MQGILVKQRQGLRSFHGRVTPALLIDSGLALLVAIANVIAISVATEPDSRPPNALAYALGIAIGAASLARRRWPLGVLLASTILLLLYYSLNFPGIPPAIALSVALYTAVEAGYLRWGVAIAVFFLGAGLFVVVVRKHEPGLLEVAQMAQQAALFAVVILLGEVVRNRRRYQDEVQERLRRTTADQEREAARQVAEERLRIARELHDVMAHTITAINVQSSLALEALDDLDDAPTQARAAVSAIRTASREAMVEIRATVGLLRQDESDVAPRAPTPGLEQLDGLIDKTRRAGVEVELTSMGEARPLTATVSAAAYRIIQESLTNVVRHAQAHSATITVRDEPAGVGISIADDGSGAPTDLYTDNESNVPSAQGGHGLRGMQERASAVGGWLRAGPQPGGGFLVKAWLPTIKSRLDGEQPGVSEGESS
jgi:signal transduction histidine kinase